MAVLLITQLGIFLLGMDAGAFASITVFCTGPASSGLSLIFGLLHLLFLGLFVVGIASLAFHRVRLPYIGILTVALLMIPVQASLVLNGTLSCDGP